MADIIETGIDAADGGLHALKMATDALNQATQEFASRRMDASVQRAFAGRHLDQISRQLATVPD